MEKPSAFPLPENLIRFPPVRVIRLTAIPSERLANGGGNGKRKINNPGGMSMMLGDKPQPTPEKKRGI
jgi:hypothetical protein